MYVGMAFVHPSLIFQLSLSGFVSCGCYMKGKRNIFCVFEVPGLEGEAREHTRAGWHHTSQKSPLAPVRTLTAICLLHLGKTSWFGSNELRNKVYNRQNSTLAVFVAAVSGLFPRKQVARTAVSSAALKPGGHEQPGSSFSARNALTITSF